MKTLYIECNMGAAGDMLMSALLELHPNAEEFLNRLNKLGIPNVTVSKTASVKCGITGTHIDVNVNGEHEDEHMHDHHDHHHDHHDDDNRTARAKVGIRERLRVHIGRKRLRGVDGAAVRHDKH